MIFHMLAISSAATNAARLPTSATTALSFVTSAAHNKGQPKKSEALARTNHREALSRERARLRSAAPRTLCKTATSCNGAME